MWVHVTIYDTPSEPLKYFRRNGMTLIPCSFPARSLTDARKTFEGLSSTATYLHLTCSLPVGRSADDDMARRILSTDLQLRGLPPAAVPWVMVRHSDSTCDHYHVLVQCRLFTGVQLEPRVSKATSRENDRVLRVLLCLEPLHHFDATAPPVLKPVTPKRRLNTPSKKRLHADLEQAFLEAQPTNFAELRVAMSRIESPFSLEEIPAPDGKTGIRHRASGPETFNLGVFGGAWWPSTIALRMAHAALLRVARPIFQFRTLISGLIRAQKEYPHEPRRPDTAHRLKRIRHSDEADGGAEVSRQSAPATARSAESAAGRRGAGYDPTPFDLNEGRRFRIEPQHRVARGICSAAAKDRGKSDVGVAESGHPELQGYRDTRGVHAAGDRRKADGWLGHFCRAALARGGRLTKLAPASAGIPRAEITFQDGGRIGCSGDDLEFLAQSPQAHEFLYPDSPKLDNDVMTQKKREPPPSPLEPIRANHLNQEPGRVVSENRDLEDLDPPNETDVDFLQ